MKMASVLATGAGAGAGARLSLRLGQSAATALIPITGALKLNAVKAVPFDFRFKNLLRLQIRERCHAVSASNSNPPGGDSIEDDKSGGFKDAPQGPPFLTILAGFLVLLLVLWVVGSILMWLISLLVRLPPFK